MIPAENPGTPAPKRERPHLLLYLFLLFSTAFLLLIMSYFMEQRRSDQQVIDGLQQSMSAMETTQSAIEQNQALTAEENQSLKDRLSALEETLKNAESQLDEQEKVTLALDWLWRIEREYFQKRYSSARALIQAFEQTGLDACLPSEALVDPDYRTPREQYNSIRNLLF